MNLRKLAEGINKVGAIAGAVDDRLSADKVDTSGTISLKSAHGKYLSIQPNTNATIAKEWETIQL